MTREEHLDWMKTRALAYADRGELTNALASFTSDATKWEVGDVIGDTGRMLLVSEGFRCVQDDDWAGMRRLIVGFN